MNDRTGQTLNTERTRRIHRPTKVISTECNTGQHGSPPCPGKVHYGGQHLLCSCPCHTDTPPEATP